MSFGHRLHAALTTLLEFMGPRYSTQEIIPQDIYSFYYVSTKVQSKRYEALSAYGESLARMFLDALRQKYLAQLVPLIQEQLHKYLGRRRTDPGAYITGDVDTTSARELDRLMRTTYRSDMQRRNTVWESFTGNLAKLEAASSPETIILAIDRLHNDIHNTGELVLTKLDHGYELEQALDACHQAGTEQELRRFVYPDLRDL